MSLKSDISNRPALDAAEPCVWMSAGLLAFHLCDRHYDCDNCPLDASLRRVDLMRRTRECPAGPIPAGDAGPMWEFRNDRLYGSGHCWVQKRGSRRLRYGLDAFAASLLAPLQGIIYPARGTRIQRGGILCWLRTGKRPIPVRSPVGGRLAQCNALVQTDPSHLTVSPYDDGWLAEIREYSRADLHLLNLASRACRTAEADNLVLKKEVDTLLRQGRRAGATLPDGGLPVTGLRELLGEPAYSRLVKRFLR